MAIAMTALDMLQAPALAEKACMGVGKMGGGSQARHGGLNEATGVGIVYRKRREG